MAARMTEEQSRASWVTRSLDFMEDREAVRQIVKRRFGNKVVSYDPSAPESNKLALDAGYTVIRGGELSRFAWQTLRDAEAVQPAGRVFERGYIEASADGEPPIPRESWTEPMEQLARYVGQFAEHTCSRGAQVAFYDHPLLDLKTAACGHGQILFNLASRRVQDFLSVLPYGNLEDLDALLIHECAHFAVGDHLTHEYHQECCRIGARLRTFDPS
jgi:hypothetical protein